MPTKTSISFGLVHIPVTISPAVRANDISFNQLHRVHKSRIKYKKVAEDSGEEVRPEDIVKGYRYAEDKYVVFSDEDFEKLKTQKDRTISIEQFSDIAEIDPIYYEKAYYVTPQKGADGAYALLEQAMEREGKVGIAKTVMGTKETLVAVRAKNGTLLLYTMYFADEVLRDPVRLERGEVAQSELELATMLISKLTKPFAIENFRDEYRLRLEEAIRQKVGGEEIVAERERESTPASSLMDALQASLAQTAAPVDAPRIKLPAQSPPNFSGLRQ